MKGFIREETRFSLCGLNCALCSIHLGGYCPGCGGGAGQPELHHRQVLLAHGGVPFCWECPEYPCSRYEGFDDGDSFVPHRNRQQDIARAQELGLEAYLTQLRKSAPYWTHFWRATTTAAARRSSIRRSIFCPWMIYNP